MAFRIVDDRFAVDLDSRRDGGMGSVYKATDLSTTQPCAIKTLDIARHGSLLHELAMQRELEALQSLRYAHIVPLLGYGIDEQLGRYLAISWLKEDLRDRCAQGPYESWEQYWLEVGQPLLSALCYAFTKNRVHRDVTPGNIMFDERGVAILIDFGISGLLDNFRIGGTLRNQKTPTYAPPEDPAKDALRDVYGFAATTVFALSGTKLTSREHLLEIFDRIALPPKVRDVLASCLEEDPDDRPSNVVVVRERIERELRSTPLEERSDVTIFLRLSRTADNQLRSLSEDTPMSALLTALSGPTYVERPRIAGGDSERITLVTASLSFLVALDRENQSVLHVIAAFETRPTHWSFTQERAFRVITTFRDAGSAGRVEQSRRAISDLFLALAEHEAVSTITDDQSIFEVWRTVLRGRMDYYGKKFPSLMPTRISVDGMRIIVSLATAPDLNLVGLSYFVEDGVSRVAVGEVESVQDDGLVLYCTANFDSESVRNAGRLRYNAAGTERAIRHQEAALDSIQAGTIPNPSLSALISDPSRAPPPRELEYEPILSHLDEDKQQAARAALGSEAAFLIVGPPGVGKTELITELVLQEIKRNPDVRILLSAQTHMAVDNALSRVKELRPDVSCVRLGKPSEKISRASGDFLLEKIATDWRTRVSERSLAAVDKYGFDRGVDVMALRAKRVAERAYFAGQQVEKCLEEVRTLTQRLAACREQQANASTTSDEIDELEESLLEKRDALSRLELRKGEAETDVWAAGQAAASLLESFQRSGNAPLSAQPDTNHDDVDRVLAIVSEWLQRLAIAQEFFPVILAESQLVAGTCLGFIGVPGTEDINYDVAIIEEASRALPTEVLVPASRARRMVLVGDEKQLPPFLEADLLAPEWLEANNLTRPEVNETLFGRLAARLPKSAVSTLSIQYRMIPAIGDMVAHVFYPRTLRSFPSAGERALKLTQLGMERNVLFFSTSRMQNHRESEHGSGYINQAEIEVVRMVVLDILRRARKKRRDKFSIVLLTPYVANRDAIEQAIAGLRSGYPDIDISTHTVHTFQGREADIAIFSCVRSNDISELGFTRDARLLNVALSRGRGGLIVVGDIEFLSTEGSSTSYRDVISYMKTHSDTCTIRDARHVG